MKLKSAQLLISIISVLFLSVVSLLAYWVTCCFAPKPRPRRNPRQSQEFSVLSLFYCFACGILIATCFFCSIPSVKENYSTLKEKTADTNQDYQDLANLTSTLDEFSWSAIFHKLSVFPEVELLLLAGFLLSLLLQQLCGLCSGQTESEEPRAEEWLSKPDDEAWEPLVIGGSGLQQQNGVAERRRRLRGPAKQEKLELEYQPLATSQNDDVIMLSGPGKSNRMTFQTFTLLLSLGTHIFCEGYEIGAQNTKEKFVHALFSVLIHGSLCALAFGVVISRQKISKNFACMLSFFLMSNLAGGIILRLIDLGENNDPVTKIFVKFIVEGIVSGVFVYTICVVMLGSEFATEEYTGCTGVLKFAFVFLGILSWFPSRIMLDT